MLSFSEWEYFIAKDEFQLYFPEGEYDIYTLAEWYKVIPTKPEKISYYGDNINLIKRHFANFTEIGDVKTKMNNDMHSNKFLIVWCMAIYNMDLELVGFSAQEYSLENGAGEKKIIYFNHFE